MNKLKGKIDIFWNVVMGRQPLRLKSILNWKPGHICYQKNNFYNVFFQIIHLWKSLFVRNGPGFNELGITPSQKISKLPVNHFCQKFIEFMSSSLKLHNPYHHTQHLIARFHRYFGVEEKEKNFWSFFSVKKWKS